MPGGVGELGREASPYPDYGATRSCIIECLLKNYCSLDKPDMFLSVPYGDMLPLR